MRNGSGGVHAGVLLNVFDLALLVMNPVHMMAQNTYVRVVAEEVNSLGVKLAGKTLEEVLKFVFRLAGEHLQGIIQERQSAALSELDDVVIGDEVGAASVEGSGLLALGQGRGRGKGEEAEKNGDLHCD